MTMQKSLCLQDAANWVHRALEAVRRWHAAEDLYWQSKFSNTALAAEAATLRDEADLDLDLAYINLLNIARGQEARGLTPGYVHRPAVLTFEAALHVAGGEADLAEKALEEAEKILLGFALDVQRQAMTG